MNEGDHRKLRGALVAGLVFLGAWKAVYWQGLLYLVLALVGVTLSHVFVPAGSTITADRAREVQAGRDRDRRLLGAYFLVNIVTFLVAGMDSGRFRWTPTFRLALAFPLVMNSYWAFVPAGIGAVLLVVRTVLEDRFLVEGLPGYADYTNTTRSRLVPGLL